MKFYNLVSFLLHKRGFISVEKEKPEGPRKRIWLDSEGEEEDESEQDSSDEEEEEEGKHGKSTG